MLIGELIKKEALFIVPFLHGIAVVSADQVISQPTALLRFVFFFKWQKINKTSIDNRLN